jgi:hypothetical protein
MNLRKMLIQVFSLIAACAAAGSGQASQVVFDGVGFLQGQQVLSQSFTAASGGELTLTLQDFAWPQSFANLDVSVSSPSGLLGPTMGAGTETFALTAGEKVVTQWWGTAQGPLDAGVYGLDMTFQPNGATVPIPTAVLLLASGLALLGWQRRQRSMSELVASAP